MPSRSRVAAPAGIGAASLVVCALLTDIGREPAPAAEPLERRAAASAAKPPTVELAFAGDVHFEDQLGAVPDSSTSTLGPMSASLADADLAMVNLESAITERGRPTDKELEDPFNRYWFRTGPDALDVLDRSGVDVVSVANNHGADYGLTGVRDTIRAGEAADLSVVGIGRNDREAHEPFRVNVRGTDIAVHAADASARESDDAIWDAAPGSGPGLASARGSGATALAAAVRESARTDDLVVVYLRWGEEGNACSTGTQQGTARMLEEAGADVVVGTHAHTPLGAGMQGSAYVSYGLGNFYWYHGREEESGVLRLSVTGDDVVADEWLPARIPDAGGAPRPLSGGAADRAVDTWRDLRGCTDLAPGPGEPAATTVAAVPDDDTLPTFSATTARIGTSVRRGMRQDLTSCPVPLADLRRLTVTHVGFDGRAHRGELVVNADVADDVVDVFEALYADRFPIERMLLVDDYGGDDDRSMAGNNTSAFNCRRVAGTSTWSDHAYGRAIDINPVQNPYVFSADDVRPPGSERFVDVDRSDGPATLDGVVGDAVIRNGGAARREFERIGWEWGGLFPDPDFQHFSAPE